MQRNPSRNANYLKCLCLSLVLLVPQSIWAQSETPTEASEVETSQEKQKAVKGPIEEKAVVKIKAKPAYLQPPQPLDGDEIKPIEEIPEKPDKTGKPGADAEEIVVTGTRIRRVNVHEYGPVTVVPAEQIKMSGITTVDELLLELPSVTLQGISKNDNNGGEGLAWVDLRNLDVGRTLVLINGRRFVATGSGSSEAVDLNNIPVQLIERVEVLLDGASTTYGSDAIGGVVNVILKDDFEGIQLDASAGMSPKMDGEQLSLSGTMGTMHDHGNIVFNVSYLARKPIRQLDRSWAKDPVVWASFDKDGRPEKMYGSSGIPEGRVGGDMFRPDPDTGLSYQPFSSPGLDHRYNYGERQWLVGEMDRITLALTADYEITRNLEVYTEAFYINRTSRNRLAPQPFIGGTATFPDGFEIPITNPYIPDDYRATLPVGTERLGMGRRMVEVGDRIYNYHSDTFRLVTGLRGDVLDDYHWDLYFNFGQNQTDEVITNSVNLARALESADPELCAANAHRGCVVGNYFGAGNLQPEVADYIRYTDIERSLFKQYNLNGSITGNVLELPAGPLGAALGAEFRREEGENLPSAITVSGDASGNGLDPTAGAYQTGELFGELSIPILRKYLFAYDLTLDLSGRYSHYDTFGADMTYRAGLSYAPVADLRLRGTYSTAFRAPGISDLYGGSADSYETLADPCSNWTTRDPNDPKDQKIRERCQADGVPNNYYQADSQIRTNVGGNPELSAETAVIKTMGFAINPVNRMIPKILRGFGFTVDYYNVTVDNAISNIEPQQILSQCYTKDTSEFCKYLERGNSGRIIRLEALSQNIGTIETHGIDFATRYGLYLSELGLPREIGRLDLRYELNYLMKFKESYSGVDEPPIEWSGWITTNKGTYAKLRWSLIAGLSGDNWSFRSIHRYIGGAKVYNPDKEELVWPKIQPVYYWDLVGQYNFGDFTFIVGLDNVLDTPPPFFMEGGQNASPAGYDFVGRYVYTRLSYKL